MTKQPLPRYIADVRLSIELSGTDEADAERRLDEIREFIAARCAKTTFKRLPGMPEVTYSDIISDVVPT